MPHLLERDERFSLRVGGDERLARAELRRQIGRLEAQLARTVSEGFGRVAILPRVEAVSRQPHLLDLGELEAIRDALAVRLEDARVALREQDELEVDNRALLERMMAAPQDYKWMRISRDDLGLPGCGHWHSRPRFGLIGMLMGWWRVRISSGCPLAGRLAAAERSIRDLERQA